MRMNKLFWAGIMLFVLMIIAAALPLLAQVPIPVPPVELPKMLLTIMSIIAPLIMQILIKPVKNETIRFLIVIVLCAGTGFAGYLMAGYKIEFSVNFITFVFTMSQLAYYLVWKPLVFGSVKAPALLQSPSTLLKG